MKTTIEIDPNVRVRGNDTFAGFEDVRGPLSVNAEVFVYEQESGLSGAGRVTEIDVEKGLVYVAVDWASLQLPVDEHKDKRNVDDSSFWRDVVRITLGPARASVGHSTALRERSEVGTPFAVRTETGDLHGEGLGISGKKVLIEQ